MFDLEIYKAVCNFYVGEESMKVFESTRGNPLRDLPEWFEKFKEKLVDDSVPEHRDAPNSSHESSSGLRAKVVSSKHSIFTHFPKDRNCDICLRTKITRAPCRKHNGTVVPRAENYGELIPAEHKVLQHNGLTIIAM